MGFFQKKKGDDELEMEAVVEKLQTCERKGEVYLHSIRTFLALIKEFAQDIKEIDSENFKGDMDELIDLFLSDEKPKKLESVIDKRTATIDSYIQKERKYIQEREKELRNIIDLLTKAMSIINAENIDYNQKIYKQSERMEEITRLDDIKKIKMSLRQEVDNIRKVVQEKQDHDDSQMKVLMKEVHSLKTELEKAKTKSLKDALTGAFNRGAFDLHIKELVRDSKTGGASPLSLLMMDIDNFKHFNDTYGHKMGDRVLMALVQISKTNLRKDDLLSRYGGEEFVVILQGASLKNAEKKAKQICRAIADAHFTVKETAKPFEISFTVSIGVSTLKKGDTVDTLTERADKALYAAKGSGKNCVVSEKKIKEA